LLSTEIGVESGVHDLIELFDTPSDLDRDLLWCVLDGSQLGTIVWPQFGSLRITPGVSTIVEARFPTLVHGAHISVDEKSIVKLSLCSPVLAPLFKLEAYNKMAHINPTTPKLATTFTVTSNRDPLTYSSQTGAITLDITHRFDTSRWNVSAGLDAEIFLRVTLSQPRMVTDSVHVLHQIETLLSLLCFDYIKSTRLELAVMRSAGDRDAVLPLYRARLVEGGALEINWKKLPLVLRDQNFGEVVDTFIEVHPLIEQTLDWYRIVLAEPRYVEDKFFYAVRMIEALYKAIDLEHEIDQEALSFVDRILMKCKDDACLIRFVNNRIAPMFKKPWSLPQIIRDLRKRYGAMCIIEILDPPMINRLRNKEAHGSSKRYTGQEYSFMARTYELLVSVYVLLVLERCGLSREFLLHGLKSRHSDWFSETQLKKIRSEIFGA